MHGGVKFYRGSPGRGALLRRGRPLARRRLLPGRGHRPGRPGTSPGLTETAGAAAVAFGGGRWTGRPTSGGSPATTSRPAEPKGRLRTDDRALRFVEVVVNGPKTWSLAAALHPEIAAAYDAAQDRAAVEIIGWLAEHATTRVGSARPAGAGARGAARGGGGAALHLAGRRPAPSPPPADQRPGLRRRRVAGTALGRGGRQHRGDQRDRARRGDVRPRVPRRRSPPTATPSTRTPARSRQLAPYAGAFSARAAQIARNIDRYEAQWRGEHPGPGAGPRVAAGAGTGARGRRRDPTRSCPQSGRRPGAALGRRSCASSASPHPTRPGARFEATPIGAHQPGRGRPTWS